MNKIKDNLNLKDLKQLLCFQDLKKILLEYKIKDKNNLLKKTSKFDNYISNFSFYLSSQLINEWFFYLSIKNELNLF